MLIDWFTVAAQAVNFLILAWLLKRFLYKPILAAMDEREQRIAAQIHDAEAQKAEAGKRCEDLRGAQEKFEQARQTLLDQAMTEASATRQRLTEESRREIDALRARWREALHADQKSLRAELSCRVQRETLAITRKVLRDLAGRDLEQQIARAFIDRLRELNGAEKARLADFVKVSGRPVVVRSAFDLPPPERVEIERTVRETLVPEARVEFEEAPDLLGGIELASDGHKIAWSIGDYLTSLEDCVREVIDQKPSADDERE